MCPKDTTSPCCCFLCLRRLRPKKNFHFFGLTVDLFPSAHSHILSLRYTTLALESAAGEAFLKRRKLFGARSYDNNLQYDIMYIMSWPLRWTTRPFLERETVGYTFEPCFYDIKPPLFTQH
jgi:hypothetical protein